MHEVFIHTFANVNFIVTVIIICSLLFGIVEYSIDIKKPYPSWIITYYQEPYVRFLSYLVIYIFACINPIISMLLMLIVVFIHLDTINLTNH